MKGDMPLNKETKPNQMYLYIYVSLYYHTISGYYQFYPTMNSVHSYILYIHIYKLSIVNRSI